MKTNWGGLLIVGLFVVGISIFGFLVARDKLHLFDAKPIAETAAADCTGVSIIVAPQFVQLDAAKEAAGITTEHIQIAVYLWDADDQRLEFWLSDGLQIWQLPVLCYDKSSKHYPIYGEVQIESLEERAARETAVREAEQAEQQ